MSTPPALVIALVLLAGAPACSAFVASSPPYQLDHRYQESGCTESRAAPVADAIIATGFTALAATAVRSMRHDLREPMNPGDDVLIPTADPRPQVAIVSGVVATTFALSSWYGWRSVSRCRRLGGAR
jgi:hypothetical protein